VRFIRAALKADATESALCAYMAWIALAGVAVNAIWGKSWADPLAALALTPLILREGWKSSSHRNCVAIVARIESLNPSITIFETGAHADRRSTSR
jgi:divalent metal cation (Fe/Co/Zn/Cd) transporter